jgi:hypothetical protein
MEAGSNLHMGSPQNGCPRTQQLRDDLEIGNKVRIWNTEKRKTSEGTHFELIQEGLVIQEDPRVAAY